MGKWYVFPGQVDEPGEEPIFEISADGNFTQAGQDPDTVITVSTSGGVISSTVTTRGITVDGGTADYLIDGGNLSLSRLSVPAIPFTSLVAALDFAWTADQALPPNLRQGADRKYHKGVTPGGPGIGDFTPGSFEGNWIASYESNEGNHQLYRLRAGKTTFRMELNDGTAWYSLARGTYTESGATATGITTHVNIPVDGGRQEVEYDDLSPAQKEKFGVPDNPTSINVSGTSFNYPLGDDPVTFTRNIFTDNVASKTWVTTFTGSETELVVNAENMWTMNAAHPELGKISGYKGVYMMTSNTTADILITHVNMAPYYEENGVMWEYASEIPDGMPVLPVEGTLLKAYDISAGRYQMIIDEILATFTRK